MNENEFVKSWYKAEQIHLVLNEIDIPRNICSMEFAEWLTQAEEDSEVTINDVWMQHIPEMPQFGAQPAN